MFKKADSFSEENYKTPNCRILVSLHFSPEGSCLLEKLDLLSSHLAGVVFIRSFVFYLLVKLGKLCPACEIDESCLAKW